MKRYGVALMFLRAHGRSPCPYVLKHIWSYVLMSLCPYVLMFSALADYYKPMSVGGKVVFHCS